MWTTFAAICWVIVICSFFKWLFKRIRSDVGSARRCLRKEMRWRKMVREKMSDQSSESQDD